MDTVADDAIEIPVLESGRLILRGFRPKDTETFLDEMTGNSIGQFEDPQIRLVRRVKAWRVLSMVMGSWLLEGHGYWVVEDKASGAVVGRIGTFAPRGWPDFEVGWEIFPRFRGLGLATEGTSVALAWFHNALGIEDFTCQIPKDNVASQSLARSLGAELSNAFPGAASQPQIWIISWQAFVASRAYETYIRGV